MLWLVFALAVFAVGVFSAACAAVGLSLILKINVASLLPEMPYFGAILLGFSCLFLAVLSFAERRSARSIFPLGEAVPFLAKIPPFRGTRPLSAGQLISLEKGAGFCGARRCFP
jgi:hypothetical protein